MIKTITVKAAVVTFGIAAISLASLPIAAQRPTAEFYFCRGREYQNRWESARAIADYNQALRINPRYTEAYFYRGNSHLNLNNYRDAIANYNQALRLGNHPRRDLVYFNRGIAQGHLKNYRAAVQDITSAINSYPRGLRIQANLYEMRGLAHFYLRNRQAAINDFQRAASIYWANDNKNDYFKTLEILEAIRRPRTTQLALNWGGFVIDYAERQTRC